jgi:FAD dependent oxidoreductase TIGR03364
MRIVVVGGGVIGTMHAYEAVRRGHEVVQIERDPDPRSASVRNFGLVWVSGRRAGAELDLALRAREAWERLAAKVPGVGFRPTVSLTPVTDGASVAVLEDVAAGPDAAARGVEVVSHGDARRLNPALGGRFLAALWCRHDAVVEPGAVLGAVRGHLESQGSYLFVPGRTVVDVSGAAAVDATGTRYDGDLVIVCPGAEHGLLGAATLAAAPVRRCRLQMMETAPADFALTTAIADADSLRYYPAFDVPAARELPPPGEATTRWGMQLLCVQRASGRLTIGDTHHYDEPFPVGVVEEAYAELAARAERLFGRPLPPIERRWSGVYSQVTDDEIYHVSSLTEHAWLVTGAGGRGMTCSPAIAAETLDRLGV